MDKSISTAADAIARVMEMTDDYTPIDLARAALSAYLAAQWRPIAEAPKDGTVIWAYHPRGSLGGLEPCCRAVLWNDALGVWETDSCYGSAEGSTGYTMFCSLPEPPKEQW